MDWLNNEAKGSGVSPLFLFGRPVLPPSLVVTLAGSLKFPLNLVAAATLNSYVVKKLRCFRVACVTVELVLKIV